LSSLAIAIDITEVNWIAGIIHIHPYSKTTPRTRNPERDLWSISLLQPGEGITADMRINREISTLSGTVTEAIDRPGSRTPTQLAEIVSAFASFDQWLDRVRLRADRRWYERLYHGPEYDVWVISWMPGQSTGFHDHGNSAGAFVVKTGSLEEHRPGERPRMISAGESRAFDSDYAHDVRNISAAPAISIHAYSPPLTEMNEYELEGDQLVPRTDGWPKPETADSDWHMPKEESVARAGAVSIDGMLMAARSRLQRLSPNDAFKAVAKTGAVLVDIRPESQRASEGTIPGALVIERNVLEWRFDPTSSSRLPIATSHDLEVIVFCSEGYTSSLAAVALQGLGLWRATDIIGGFKEWREQGLPISTLR
jgi:rhodanese-related sulfurtransferase/mannose-6-phosphate isomerase-like protein (cupin superfamily)